MVWLAVACTIRPAPAPDEGAVRRWVSLAPPITETVAAVGALEDLVGRSDWCTSPPEVIGLPAVGSELSPNLEAIVALRPTLVLVEAAPSSRVSDLAAIAPTEALSWLTVADLVASTRRIGELAGKTEQAETLAEAFTTELKVDPPAQGPRVLLALAGEGLDRGEVWFLKRNSLHGAALHAAGARNAVDRDVPGVPVLPVEQVLALNPDAIVVLAAQPVDDAARAQVLADWGRLAPLTAVREGHVAVLGGPELLSTGPSILTLGPRLHEALHGLGVL